MLPFSKKEGLRDATLEEEDTQTKKGEGQSDWLEGGFKCACAVPSARMHSTGGGELSLLSCCYTGKTGQGINGHALVGNFTFENSIFTNQHLKFTKNKYSEIKWCPPSSLPAPWPNNLQGNSWAS